jgi:hypothetical protein
VLSCKDAWAIPIKSISLADVFADWINKTGKKSKLRITQQFQKHFPPLN